jgi:predicted RNase H-like nuclease (RuvC/YqgF family)
LIELLADMLYSPVESLARAAARLSSVWEQNTVQAAKQQQRIRRLEAMLVETERWNAALEKTSSRARVEASGASPSVKRYEVSEAQACEAAVEARFS